MTKIRKKKNPSDTGAKKEIRAAIGPGFIFCGISMPIPLPAIRSL